MSFNVTRGRSQCVLARCVLFSTCIRDSLINSKLSTSVQSSKCRQVDSERGGEVGERDWNAEGWR